MDRVWERCASIRPMRQAEASSTLDEPRASKLWLGVAWLACASLIVLRDTALVTSPRFWAEEGIVYFNFANQHSFAETLGFVHFGYLALFANIAVGLAAMVPAATAPLVTLIASAAGQLFVAGFVLFHQGTFLRSTAARICAVAVVTFVGMGGELWLNTINTSHHFPIVVFLVAISDKANLSRGRTAFALGIVVFLGLSSVVACLVTPLFLLRYLRERQGMDLVLGGALGLVGLVQLGLMASYSAPLVTRFGATDETLGRFFYYLFTYPVLPISGEAPLRLWAGLLTVPLMLVLGRKRENQLFILGFLICTIAPFLGSIHMIGGVRYAYGAVVIFHLLMLRAALDSGSSKLLRSACGAALAIAMVTGAACYKSGWSSYSSPQWTTWASEVEAWEAAPRSWVQVHPQAGGKFGNTWRFKLRPDEIRLAAEHGTAMAVVDERQVLLPVVHVPTLGNMRLALRRSEEGVGLWEGQLGEMVSEEEWPMARFSLNLGQLAFVDDQGEVVHMRVASISEDFIVQVVGP